MSTGKRYAKIAPLSVEDQARFAMLALQFYAPLNHKQMCGIIGAPVPQPSEPIYPFSGWQYIEYLGKSGILPQADAYHQVLDELLKRLVSAGYLKSIPWGGRSVTLGEHYYAMHEFTTLERQGNYWLTKALGPAYAYKCYSPFVLQLSGRTSTGDCHAGSGIAIGKHHVLTCAHVVNDMTLDEQQEIGGNRLRVIRSIPHQEVDVALVEFEGELPTMPGLAFEEPWVGSTVYTMGFPLIPLSRSPALVMQSGEVTAPIFTTIPGQDIFLFSAVARPGNSGGPIISSSGRVVGIVSQELFAEAERPITPFFAGIATSTIKTAVEELSVGVSLPVETFD